MNPFLYPKNIHIRRQNPPSYRQYQQYKPYLRKEFERKCIYCRMPDFWSRESFGVDHYQPKQQFPTLATVYANLYYCCNSCNSRKGEYWPNGAKDRVIPNPCDHRMAEHLRYKGAVVEAKTTWGSFTCDLLDLNAPDAIEKRAFMLEIIRKCQSDKAEYLEIQKVVKEKIRKGTEPMAEAQAALAKIEGNIIRVEEMIRKLAGVE